MPGVVQGRARDLRDGGRVYSDPEPGGRSRDKDARHAQETCDRHEAVQGQHHTHIW